MVRRRYPFKSVGSCQRAMKRRAVPGSLSLENNRRGSEGSREGGVGQHHQHHQGWQIRGERSSACMTNVPSSGLGRSPLREAPAGNSKGNSNSKGLRPHEVPYARNAGGTTTDGEADKGITLRCMYTHQKTKKRKTWSDGAVKCCPKRSRVALYRWSDALGVTDKLLGEIYLTAPQYEAFVTQGEPELEMETFLVSLDGVIQPDDGPSAGTTNSAVGGVEESAAAGGTSGGAGAGGKKRKLFKAFKPPARRAPPPAPPSDDSWPPPRPGMMGQLRNGEPNGDGGGMMSPRTSYNGFGHVESLWDDEDDDQEYNGEGVYRRDDRGGLASGPGGSAAASGAGWGMDAGAGDPNAREVGGGEGTCPGRMKSSSMPSAAAAVSPIASEWTSRQEDGWHAGGRNASSGLLRSAGDIARHFPAQPDKDPADRGQGQDDPSPYLESLRSGGRGAEEWPGPTYSSSAQRGGGHDVDGAGDQGHYYSEHPRHDDDGRVPREGRPIERNAAAQYGGEVRDVPEADLEQPAGRGDSGGRAAGAVSQHGRETLDAPEADREQPAGRGDSSGRVSAGAVEMRSTQDILSLFGGLEEDGGEHGYAGPRGPETAPATLQHSRGPNDATARPETTGGVLLPVGGGTPRAADMRRAQKESRAAATAAAGGAAATAAAAGAALAGSVNPGTGPAAASGVAADAAPPLGDWACGVCGVRGGASATSCRVCGAPRQGPIDEGFPGQGGGVDRHGVVDGFSGSEHRRGWDAADFRRGEDWQEQEWDGVAKNGNAGGGAGGHDELGGDGRAEGILLHGGEDVLGGSGHPGSYPVCSPPSRMEREGGAEGGVARGFGSVPRASGEQHRARMQIDVGSSSDSDDA